MFNHLLHNHDLPTTDDGVLATRRATCAEAEAYHAPHTVAVRMDDGKGGTRYSMDVVNCHAAELERQQLLRQVGELEGRAASREAQARDYRRLMGGAMQIVFHMGPALRDLLSENLGDPTLTDDGTAVKVEHPLFTVVIDPFGERITVRPVLAGVNERSFAVVNGRISEDDQTLLLGHVARIRKAEADVDPVRGTITLVAIN